MRSLVFLPPPTLSQFGTSPTRQTTFTVPSPLHHHRAVRILADETRRTVANEHVPDSVDPHHELFEEQDESIARSEVPDAPAGVPWEVLHRDVVEARAHKRVRIRSPVLVIETPERRPPSARVAHGTGSTHCQEVGADAEADKSRVVLGQDSDDDGEHDDTGEQKPDSRIPAMIADETNAALPYLTVEHRSNDAEANAALRDTEHSDQRRDDLSLLAGIPISRAAPAAAQGVDAQHTHQASQSASSLQIRPPIPAAVTAAAPQATCRFTFFSKRPPPLSTSVATVSRDIDRNTHAQPPTPALALAHDPPAAMHPAKPHDTSLLPLPEMNAFEATYDSLPFRIGASESAEHSIVPPPTLQFTLAHITPVARILAQPMQFISAVPRAGSVGGVSSKVNLLVVVKEVGEMVYVRDGFAAKKGAEGRTERVELLVMDGRMGVRPAESVSVVDEPAERYLFTVVLWGPLAPSWTTPSPDPTSSPPTTTTPTPLHPGDVLALTNLTLSPRTPPHADKRRLGTGVPARITVAHASTHAAARIELCYRADASAAHGARNFDAELAHFDLRSRRVLELARLWRCHQRK
ncbi:conserved hypothetical protein [Sporisorium reilianum SRZ2]|uniref:Uncharacterized protein n=1 Tax=Sporisorium reilianum (strain SRZ2) TaxID=999809 RepID=E6ZM44_SPORE|nr:conserved hypothetical protein [Sporisorium reilianum SRZ2]